MSLSLSSRQLNKVDFYLVWICVFLTLCSKALPDLGALRSSDLCWEDRALFRNWRLLLLFCSTWYCSRDWTTWNEGPPVCVCIHLLASGLDVSPFCLFYMPQLPIMQAVWFLFSPFLFLWVSQRPFLMLTVSNRQHLDELLHTPRSCPKHSLDTSSLSMHNSAGRKIPLSFCCFHYIAQADF